MTEEQITELIAEVRWVIAAFDQVNTNRAVERLGSRGEILKACVDDLREILQRAGIDPYPPPKAGEWILGYGPGEAKVGNNE